MINRNLTTKTNKMKRIVSLSLVGLLLWSCGNPSEILDSFTIRISPELMEHTAMVEVFDANDPTLALNNLQVSFDGEYADDLFEISGVQNFQLVDGRINLGLHPRANPTPDNPVVIKMNISADGYLAARYDLVFLAGGDAQLVQIPLVSISNPPSGVNFRVEPGVSLSNGTLSSDYSLKVDPGVNSSTGMEVNLPSGTSFIDRQGNAISGSNLSLEVGHFDSDNDASLDAFPGGFTPDSVILDNGSVGTGSFLTAGFTTMNMTVDGVEVKSFSQPITVTMDISANAINPSTGSTVAIGDKIPVWSYDEVEGTWEYETEGDVVQGPNGLQVSYQTTHLSWWNLDFYGDRCCGWRRVGSSWQYSQCAGVNISLPGWPAGTSEYFRVKIVWAGTNQAVSYYADRYQSLYDGKFISYYNAPSGQVQMKVYDNNGNLLAQSQSFNFCSGDVNVTFNLPQPVLISFAVEGVCANNSSVSIRPSFWVYYRETGQPWYRYLGYVYSGNGTTSKVELNKRYDFVTYFNGQRIEVLNQLVDQTNYDIQLELGSYCDDL